MRTNAKKIFIWSTRKNNKKFSLSINLFKAKIMRKTTIYLTVGAILLGGTMFLLFGGYALLEPIQLKAASTTATTSVSLTVGEEITLTAPASIALSPNITMTQQSSVGSGVWTVKTNNAGGYTLEFTTSATNALTTGSASFTDISTTSPAAWSVSADSYIWGYSGYGTDIATSTWGDATACGTAAAGGLSTSLNYAGFASTTTVAPTIASKNTATGSSGATTTLCIAAEEGDSVYAPDGSYSAVVTGTATTQ